jgi:hypothetical protein
MIIIAVIAFLIILSVFAIVYIRLLWVYVRTFINIILLVIFSPILILAGVFPGENTGFGSWVRNLAAQLAVYPTVIVMVFLAHFMFWSSVPPGDAASIFVVTNPATWIPALFAYLSTADLLNPFAIERIGSAQTINLPGYSFGTGMTLGFIVSFGILFLVPSVSNIIQSVISRRPFSYGTAIGAAIMTGAGPVLGAAAYPFRESYGIWSAAQRKAIETQILKRLFHFGLE